MKLHPISPTPRTHGRPNAGMTMLLAIVTILLGACAKVAAPVGGPRDTMPPKIVKEVPANQSVNFHEKQIRITMDEFFTLNNPNDNVMVSPPFVHPIDFSINGKTLTMKIKDTLRENTTYNIVFSNCIQDFNENNKLNFYQYSFSSGSYIDSFMIDGKVQNAFTLESEDNFLVMLYREDNDSLPLNTLPTYVTRTQKDGTFHFRNISEGDYTIFALKDINSNYFYDLPNEVIAFNDTRIQAYPPEVKDSIGNILNKDSTRAPLLLHSFVITDPVPKLLHYDNPEAGMYRFPFSTSVGDLQSTFTANPVEYFQKWSANRDTLTWYLKSLDFDTIPILFTRGEQIDTVLLKPYKAKQTTGGRGTRAQEAPRLKVSFSKEGHCCEPMMMHFSYPVKPVDSFPVFLSFQRQGVADTVVSRFSIPDSFIAELPIPLDLENKKSYTLMIPDSMFFGYNNLTNDTIRLSFTSKSEKEYGNIQINYRLTGEEYPVIVQLWRGKSIVQQHILQTDSTIVYPHLEPDGYHIRAILDINGNGRWDSGDYPLKRQPEPIIPFAHDIHVRAFWDVEEDFKIDRSR